MPWHQRFLFGAMAALTSSFMMLVIASTAHFQSVIPYFELA